MSENENLMIQMKVTDLLAKVLEVNGVRSIFGVSGGASLHLLDSVRKRGDLKLVTVHHEQAAAMAADSVSRFSNSIGVAIATSGPGATNLITGIAGCFYDSVPTIFITGQVSTNRLSKNLGVRQIGFQETPIIDMVVPITKFAYQIKYPQEVLEMIHSCIRNAISGRPGPTLLDIPDDVQRMLVNVSTLELNKIIERDLKDEKSFLLESFKEDLKSTLANAKRPVLVLGWGVHLARVEETVVSFASELGWPILLTWGGADLISYDNPLRIGTFGTHGNRDANFTIQNSDLILSLGSRLDLKSTGSPPSSFAPNAKKIVLDIDSAELDKFQLNGPKVEFPILMDMRSHIFGDFLKLILDFRSTTIDPWLKEVENFRNELRFKPKNFQIGVEPYTFIKKLSEATPGNSRIYFDTGCAIAWGMQAWEPKKLQRIFHDFNNTAMGWALPAAIASANDDDKIPTIAIIGDGSFMMSVQELATLKSLKKPLRIFLLNNGGYSMIKQTQDQWFDGEYFASGDGMSFPDFRKLSESFDMKYFALESLHELDSKLQDLLLNETSFFCEVAIPEMARVEPQVKFGSPIQSMEPEIPAELFKRLMINLDK